MMMEMLVVMEIMVMIASERVVMVMMEMMTVGHFWVVNPSFLSHLRC